jgi:hypothetical protein
VAEDAVRSNLSRRPSSLECHPAPFATPVRLSDESFPPASEPGIYLRACQVYLASAVNLLASLLAALTLLTYLFLYTPLKRFRLLPVRFRRPERQPV